MSLTFARHLLLLWLGQMNLRWPGTTKCRVLICSVYALGLSSIGKPDLTDSEFQALCKQFQDPKLFGKCLLEEIREEKLKIQVGRLLHLCKSFDISVIIVMHYMSED